MLRTSLEGKKQAKKVPGADHGKGCRCANEKNMLCVISICQNLNYQSVVHCHYIPVLYGCTGHKGVKMNCKGRDGQKDGGRSSLET